MAEHTRHIGLTMQDVYDITQRKIDLLRDLRATLLSSSDSVTKQYEK